MGDKPKIAWPQGAFDPDMKERIATSKVLVVGAGGIGCELLKTLVLTGFKDIETIDLDTIEVSNLNRQFLFRKHHVGQSKASVAAAAVRSFRPAVAIAAHQANVKESRYDVDFFRRFDLCLNGLDNLDARRHVNRMCLAAGIPLVESGTAGYLGQVSVHVGGATECFDCQPKPVPKSYAVCTIRTSPDKPIHCVVWAKDLLFPLLFGPPDGESDLDPAGKLARLGGEPAPDFARRVFTAVFDDKIAEVLKTAEPDVWEGRAKPVPVRLEGLLEGAPTAAAGAPGGSAAAALGLADHNARWTTTESAAVFLEATRRLLEHRADEVGSLSFDKDDALAVEFVASAANLRAAAYAIPPQSLFDTKGMAGNIIHAIATTNAIIAGLIVVEATKLLATGGDPAPCRATFLRQDPSNRKLVVPVALEPPAPGCVVCGAARLRLRIDTAAATLGDLVARVLRGHLGLVEPTLMFGDAAAAFQYEEGADLDAEEVAENARHLPTPLAALPAGGVRHGTVIEVGDQAQSLTLQVTVAHQAGWDEGTHPHRFAVEGEVPVAGAEEEDAGEAGEGEGAPGQAALAVEDADGALVMVDSDGEDSDGDIVIVDGDDGDDGGGDEGPAGGGGAGIKRKRDGGGGGGGGEGEKRAKREGEGGQEDEDGAIVLD